MERDSAVKCLPYPPLTLGIKQGITIFYLTLNVIQQTAKHILFDMVILFVAFKNTFY